MINEILWTSGYFNERFSAPVSPLGWSLLGPLIEEIALRDPLRFLGYPDAERIPLTRLWHGHPYANALAFQIYYKVFPDFLLPEDAYRYFPDGDVSLRQLAPYPRSIVSPRFLWSLFRAFLSDPFNVSPLHNWRHWARYAAEHDRRVGALRARVAALAHAEPHDIFAALREAERTHRDLLRIHRWSLTDADLLFGLLKHLTRAWVDREHGGEIAARLVADVPNKTLEVDAALQELAEQLRPVETVMTRAQFLERSPAVQFLAAHGHRSYSLDIAVPTFADEPMQVVRLLQNIEGEQKRAWRDARSFAVVDLQSPVQRFVFAVVVSLTRRYVAMREGQRYYWQKSLAVSRHLYLLLADRLVADGVIGNRDDVFYATHQELVDYFDARLGREDLTQSIVARKAEWSQYGREFEQSPAQAYPLFLQGDVPLNHIRRAPVPVPPAEWRGKAISPGRARGVARVVQSASELARVQHGEILVAPSTDPAWTPIFVKIAGLVVARGGVLSHSAVVAREYRVPAVAGIATIVDEIRDGELIEVDGSGGLVRRVVR